MQALARDGLTAAQVTAILSGGSDLHLSAGLELVDLSLAALEDISTDLQEGTVSRNSYAKLHATAQLRITRELDWGAALLRPYMRLSSGGLTARWNLGVYHPSTPELSTEESPQTFAVDGYDILLRLRQPVGDSYAIAAGDAYLAVVEQILVGRGYQAYLIDQAAAGMVAPSARAWVFDDQTTWLTIVNDLLSSIGYQGIWSDWDGRVRCEPYVLPQLREVEWTYTDDPATTMLAPDRRRARDFFAAPNRWVVYRTGMTDGETPVEGAGIYTWVNDAVGDTSVQARGGLVITKVAGVDAADQSALVAQAQQIIQDDMDIPAVWSIGSSPHPGHWHFDRLFVDTAELLADVQCTAWTLPLDGGDMTQEWRVIAQ